MRFSEADNSGGHLIDGYGSEGLLIDGRRYRRGLILTPTRIIEDWGPTQAADLTAAHLEEVLALAPQILVLGTGARQVFPDPALYARLMQARIGIEIMDTGAACRTYNILMSEGRRVAAGLMPL
ncbi:Mth938-like domain-containing protein [Thiocystis violacea]|uniref:Mth938-like domain-containing protein n=1 Tax=Thiocystis violacea TaxID=13725 RepID=UPI001903CD31|nr:Mth938-like domain-containing protein [Thiocystis violacea]MBK1717968.1 hypothetical protein [Thiocystis violacea]